MTFEGLLYVGLEVTPRSFVVGLVLVLALILGLIWTLTNFYQFYPLVQSFIESLDALNSSTHAGHRPEDFVRSGRLPRIDILLPAYNEGNVIDQAIRSMRTAEYPTERLSIHVLLEPGDGSTLETLMDLKDEFQFQIHFIPERYPGEPNKPRALNYGFSKTHGDIVGVIDAEDIVDQGLFNEVGETYRREQWDFALAHLDMANEDDGWLNLLFRAEYGFWYNLVVPAFARVGYPIPLGGTTCFFRRSVLEEISDVRESLYGSVVTGQQRAYLKKHNFPAIFPWDHHNVTEDFELGLVLWDQGYEFTYLESVTREESPLSLNGWLDQRTRWNKGKLFTFLQFLREPPARPSHRAHLYWQSVLPHLGPVNILGIGVIFWFATLIRVLPGTFVKGLLSLGLAFALLTTGLYVLGYWSVSDRPVTIRTRRAAVVGLTAIFYWLLQWIADLRALVKTYSGQLDWEPTEHLGRHFETAQLSAGELIQRPAKQADYATRERWLVLAGILMLGLVLRTVALDRWSLWHDELYTITERGSAPLLELLTMTSDPHPPLYYLFVHGWVSAFGSGPTPARVLSILFSVGVIWGVYLLARALYDDRTALLSALLVAVSTLHIHFGRTVRMYSLFALMAVLSWYGYVRLRDVGTSFSRSDRRSVLKAVFYFIATLGLLYTHIYGLFVVFGQYVHRYLTDPADRLPERPWRLIHVGIGLIYLPWAVVLYRQVRNILAGTGESTIGWIPPPSIMQVRDVSLMWAGYPSFYPINAETTLAFLVAFILLGVINVSLFLSVLTHDSTDGGTYYFVDGSQAGLLALALLVPIVVPLAVSYLLVPIIVPRYTIAVSFALFILVARGIVNISDQRWQIAFVAVLLIGATATSAIYYSSDSAEDWRGIADEVETSASPGDLVVYQPTWIASDVDYYYEGPPLDRTAFRDPSHVSDRDLARLEELAVDHDRIWLVLYRPDESNELRATITETHALRGVYDGGVVTLYRFETGRSQRT